MKTSLVVPAAKFARTHPAELWRVCCAYTPRLRCLSKQSIIALYKDQTALGTWCQDMEDFCLYVLAKRIPLYVHYDDENGIRDVRWIIRPWTVMKLTDMWKDGELKQWEESQ